MWKRKIMVLFWLINFFYNLNKIRIQVRIRINIKSRIRVRVWILCEYGSSYSNNVLMDLKKTRFSNKCHKFLKNIFSWIVKLNQLFVSKGKLNDLFYLLKGFSFTSLYCMCIVSRCRFERHKSNALKDP